MNRYLFISAIFTMVFLTSCQKKTETAGAAARSGAMSVEVFIAGTSVLENIIHIPGSILPNEQVEIRSELSGRISALNFVEGSFVREGTLLVKVDDTELKAQLHKLEAQIKLARSDQERKKQLLEMNGISQDEYDIAFTRVRELEADIDLLELRINKSNIRAPFDGHIGLRMISLGAYISPGDIISSLVQTTPVKVEFNVPEKYVSYIKTGKDLSFTVSGGSRNYTGRIFATDPMINPSNRALKVRALCENADGSLVPGSFVEITLELEKIDNALMIPTTAIVPLMNSQNVYVLRNGLATLTEVIPGIRQEKMVQISQGIKAGDTLAVTGLLAIRNGMPVIVTKINQE